MKHYMDINRIKEKYTSAFTVGEKIVVQTKIDGSNASFTYNPDTDSIVAFSRKQVLSKENNLRGFYEFAIGLPVDIVKQITQNGRFIIFGEYLCLSGDTIIKKASSGNALNTMTLKEMYEHNTKIRKDVGFKRGIKKLLYLLYEKNASITIHNYNSFYHLDKNTTIDKALQNEYIALEKENYVITEKGINYLKDYYKKNSQWGHDGLPSIYSLNLETDSIQTNKIQDIVYTGKKEVYELITHKGYHIKATQEHPFLTPTGWKKLKDLNKYDCVAITDFISKRKHGRTYGKGSRVITLMQKDFKERVGKCQKCGSTNSLELHHIDEDYTNNNIENWMVLCKDCHKTIHTKKANQPLYEYEFDYIVDIVFKGVEDCYDIAMEGNENLANFIANGFIVHNCKHTVKYPEEMYNKFYMFDVWDTEDEIYLPYEESKEVFYAFHRLTNDAFHSTFRYVPLVYCGPFRGWAETMKLLDAKTTGAQPCEEGIVIKSQERFEDDSRSPIYLKIVNEKFSEVHDTKPKKVVDPAILAAREEEEKRVATIVNYERVNKMLFKLIDEGIVPVDWDEKSMGLIMKNMPRRIVEDCIKEEPEIVESCEHFGKIAGSLVGSIVRKMLAAR